MIWFGPVLLAALLLGPSHVLVDLGLFFSKLAVLTFGGAYALLAWLAQAAVETKGWLTAPEMLDGLGLAETTPGPTILVNQFVGFIAALRAPGTSAALSCRNARCDDGCVGDICAILHLDLCRRAFHG